MPTIFSKAATYKDALQGGNAIEVLSASIEETAKAFPNISFEILTIVEGSAEKNFALEWSMKGTNTGSFFGADIIKIKDEKIISIKSYYDSSQFSTQLGI